MKQVQAEICRNVVRGEAQRSSMAGPREGPSYLVGTLLVVNPQGSNPPKLLTIRRNFSTLPKLGNYLESNTLGMEIDSTEGAAVGVVER
jgi:hypothetical protein